MKTNACLRFHLPGSSATSRQEQAREVRLASHGLSAFLGGRADVAGPHDRPRLVGRCAGALVTVVPDRCTLSSGSACSRPLDARKVVNDLSICRYRL